MLFPSGALACDRIHQNGLLKKLDRLGDVGHGTVAFCKVITVIRLTVYILTVLFSIVYGELPKSLPLSKVCYQRTVNFEKCGLWYSCIL